MVKRECRISVEGGLHARAGLKREREGESFNYTERARVRSRCAFHGYLCPARWRFSVEGDEREWP